MTIELDDVTSGYNVSVINGNFQTIEDKMNQEVLWRGASAVAGESKMERDLDMDGHRILNADLDGSTITNDRAVRVSTGYLPPIPQTLEERKGAVVSFDINTGDPIALAPASGSAVDVLNQLANNSDVTKGDALVALKQPFTGAIARTVHSKMADSVSAKDFATGDGVTDDYAKLMQAYQWAAAHGKSLFIPAGIYMFSQKLVFDTPGVFIFGEGMNSTSLRFTGTGTAIEFNDSIPNNGIYSFSGGIADLEVVGNANTTNIIYNKNVNHWYLSRVNAREASTINGVGLRVEGPTGCHIQHFVCSTNAQLMSSRPFVGIWMDAIITTGGRTAATTLLHPIIEGMTGDGVHLRGCDQLTWIGGTSENNGGNGVTFSDNGQPRINTLIGVGFEANLGFADIFDAGQMNRFINCTSTKLSYFGVTSLFAELSGGYHQSVLVEGNFTTLHDLKYSFFANGGTFVPKENTKYWNLFNTQTSAIVNLPKPGHLLALTGSPMLFTNTFGFPIDVMMHVDSAAVVSSVFFCEGTTPNVKVDATGGIRLDPGNSLQITYTGSPTFYWMPR
ncbi:putative tail protein [Citrobacter phage CVT22]|uniref:Tail protein n=1 Tax=Citrobacter phage CVT22 TaxID=1622234 RepID=A0A0R6CKP4_9CAUD|nr:tail protein [Citrobacter phage CVT22]AJT60706.1 putative tail protein [Citrobacter phage CVT22]